MGYMNKNKISIGMLLGGLTTSCLLYADEYIVRAPVDADLSQWQNMPPEYGDWESISEPYACSSWAPDTFDYLVGEPVEQTQTCSQDMERTVTIKQYDSFSGEEIVISEDIETDTHTIANERDATGTRSILPPEHSEWVDSGEPYDCSEWTPDVSTIPLDQSFIQTQTCQQEQEQTVTVWAEDISTGKREVESQETVNQIIDVQQEQDALGTKIVRNMCVDILNRGESTGNGVYSVYPEGGTPKNAYCDMSGGGWTLYDSFGTQLIKTGGANPDSYNAKSINSYSAISQAGYAYAISTLNSSGYAMDPHYMQFHLANDQEGYIKKIMPNWVDSVKVYVTAQWHDGDVMVQYGADQVILRDRQGHTPAVFHGGGKELYVAELLTSLTWIDSVWIK